MALLSTPQLTSVRLPLRKVKPAVPAFGISRVPLRVCRVAEDFKHPLYHHHDKMDHDLVMQLRAEKVEKYLKGWKPDHEMSSRWNVMTLLMMVAFASPLLGLGFAAATYGTLWGISAATQLPL